MDQKEMDNKRREAYAKITEAFKIVTTKDWQGNLDIKQTVFNCKGRPSDPLTVFLKDSVLGFNVRLGKDDFIIPLLGGDKWKKIMDQYYKDKKDDPKLEHPVKTIIKKINPAYTIPEIFKGVKEQEVFFTFEKESNGVFCIKGLNVKHNANSLKNKLLFKESFALVQRNELFPAGEKVYFWISREMQYEDTYLSNILVLSTNPESIKFARQNHVKLLRFLFDMETAYAIVLENKRKRDAIKSAKSAIMSRNMSHNLGSHVMFYIKQKLESVEKILATGALKELIQSQSIDELKQKIQSHATPGNEMPFLVGLGRFLNYLQERQDFIATVATNYIPYRTCINFKDAIYDELKPEKHAQRHDGDATGKKAANLLLDYIAYSEGFTSSEVVELWFGDSFNGGTKPEDVPDELREFRVALPGGNLGRQAFFSIMENIIRNTAKHDGGKVDGGKLRFQFDVIEPSDFKEIKISGHSLRSGEARIKDIEDEIKRFNTTCYNNNDKDFKYLGITIKLREAVSAETLKSLFNGLQRGYITPDGQMDEECKGLKEIRLSAAWLRGHELDDEIPINEPPAVAIRKTREGHLQYIICLPKPKKVACIVAEKRNTTILQKIGVDTFGDSSIDHSTIKEIANYEYVVVDKSLKKRFSLLRKNVGARVFKMDIDEITSVNQIYNKWLEIAFKIKKDALPVISVLDGNGKGFNVDRDENTKVRESGTSERRDAYFKDSIVYFRHYFGQHAYEKTARETFAKALFIETVSGGNSTYRLVRQDKRNYEWYTKQIAAGLTKVAIFDERLYGMIMPEGDYDLEDIKSEVLAFFKDKAIESKAKTDIWKAFRSKILIEAFNINEDLAFDIYNNELKSRAINKSAKSNSKAVIEILSKYLHIKDYSKTWQYREAGIWAFNIKTESGKVKIIGYNAPVKKNVGEYMDSYREVEIAVVENDGEIRINPIDKPDDFEFDFITIHQGILDKIYSTLKIDKQNKGKVTAKLYKSFANPSSKQKSDNSFLPQFIIHSGRSKPNIKDMPQKQPFLQFSALDHALRDCKFTLVELLNSAHYEESNYYYSK